jgi:hypothetical protein
VVPPYLAAVDVVGFIVSRYFGLRSYGEISGCMFVIFTVGTGLGRVLMGLSFGGALLQARDRASRQERWHK